MDYDGPLSEQNPEVIFGKASDPFTMSFKITNQIYGPYRPNWPLRVFKTGQLCLSQYIYIVYS